MTLSLSNSEQGNVYEAGHELKLEKRHDTPASQGRPCLEARP